MTKVEQVAARITAYRVQLGNPTQVRKAAFGFLFSEYNSTSISRGLSLAGGKAVHDHQTNEITWDFSEPRPKKVPSPTAVLRAIPRPICVVRISGAVPGRTHPPSVPVPGTRSGV